MTKNDDGSSEIGCKVFDELSHVIIVLPHAEEVYIESTGGKNRNKHSTKRRPRIQNAENRSQLQKPSNLAISTQIYKESREHRTVSGKLAGYGTLY